MESSNMEPSNMEPSNIDGISAWNSMSDLSQSTLATMLLEAAARFADLPTADFDQVIVQTLDQLAAHLQMEHVGLSLFVSTPLTSPSFASTPAVTVQASQPHLGVERRYVAGGTNLPSAQELTTPYPWYAAQLQKGHSIILPHGPADLPPEAEAERL